MKRCRMYSFWMMGGRCGRPATKMVKSLLSPDHKPAPCCELCWKANRRTLVEVETIKTEAK